MSTGAIPILPESQPGFIQTIGRITLDFTRTVGDMTLFCLELISWLALGLPRRGLLLPCLYQVGVQGVPVIFATGGFIGMVIAMQSYPQFRLMHMETNLGAVVNVSLVKELGPVLASVMLAGRVGCAMAAELGTMKITEQMDALQALGAHPIRHLVIPRLIACLVMVPLLNIIADCAGMLGGWLLTVQVYGVTDLHYWTHSDAYVGYFELLSGLVKSVIFGGALAVIACHRGFRCRPGAEGVGRAATEAFVFSFVAILVLDFILGVVSNHLYDILWPSWSRMI